MVSIHVYMNGLYLTLLVMYWASVSVAGITIVYSYTLPSGNVV
jgi:hypothetical protein